MNNKKTSGGLRIADFKLYYWATVMKTAWKWHKQTRWWMKSTWRLRHQFTRLWMLFLYKAEINTYWEKDSNLKKWCCSNWVAAYGRIQIDLHLKLYPKLNSKWIKDFSIRPDVLNTIEENWIEYSWTHWIRKNFLNRTAISQAIRAVNKLTSRNWSVCVW